MIVAGTVNYKMASRLSACFTQMAEPKYVIAMGACTVGAALFQVRIQRGEGRGPGGCQWDVYVPAAPRAPSVDGRHHAPAGQI